MAKTRGNLVAARIYEIDHKGEEVNSDAAVTCMFNPFEYSVSKNNTYSEKSKNRSKVSQKEFTMSGSQTLKLSLTFDEYESGEDVSLKTEKLWRFMEPPDSRTKGKVSPPQVAFEWGVFCFRAAITNMTQKFTLFKKDGMPVRAKVDVVFEQLKDYRDYERQNPTSGGGPVERVWQVTLSDRLDTIAYAVYGDATKWRLIAARNQIDNPMALRTGQQLTIPMEGSQRS